MYLIYILYVTKALAANINWLKSCFSFIIAVHLVTKKHIIIMKQIWNAAAVAFTGAVTPYWTHSCIVVVIDIHHPNTLWIDGYSSNAKWYCLELTVINVALHSCYLNAVLIVPSRLSQEATGVKTHTSAVCVEFFLSNARSRTRAEIKVGAATTDTKQ